MLKQHNRKVQMQLVFHSLPSIAVSKRNELVDGSWAPQLVQFISQYFNCDVVTLPWMWAQWKPQANNRGWMQTIQVMGHSKGWPCYELMQSKKHIHTHCPTIFAGAAGTLALNEHSFQAAVQKLSWQSKDISQPHLASVSVWPHTHCLAKQVMSIVYDGS